MNHLVDGKPFRVSLEEARKNAITIIAILETAGKRIPIDVKF